ncbi:MAG: hypothetical protein WC372_09270 [Candidatus Neomarinimicrobiota bacterium]|jgi:hypothetical protein
MPEDRREQAEKELEESLHLRQRRAVNNAYSALEGRKIASAFAAFTFEEAADAQIELIEGQDTQAHPNYLNRVAALRGEIERAVDELKSLPPETFRDVRVDEQANSPESGDDDTWGEYAG